MKILHRHILTTVITMTAFVVMVIFGLLAFIGFINEIRELGTGQYGAWQAFVFVITSLPHDFYPLFPAAVLIGCLIGLGRLAAYSELIVMRASGVSKTQITLCVIRATILMLIFATALGEWAGPMLKNYAIHYKIKAKTGNELSEAKSGVWVRDGQNFLHIGEVTASGELEDVIRYEFSGQHLVSASHADKGERHKGRWIFQNVSVSMFSPNAIIIQHFPNQQWPVSLDPKLISALDININSQPTLKQLYRYISYMKSMGLSSRSYEFDLWKRIFQPLATLVMIGLGVPFIFGPLRTVTMGLRILIGVVIGFVFYTFNAFLGPFSLVYQVPPLWAAASPVLLFAVIDGLVWWRVK
jgi:lipopolysaccharide export system permease protein